MKRFCILVGGAALALALAAPAAAKGPDQATITGPGLERSIVLGGNSEGDVNSAFWRFTQGAGFMEAVFLQQPDPMRAKAPNGDLGPKYEIVWRVPRGELGPAFAHQALYPHAAGGPVTYMQPGQPLYGGDHRTHGGWFRSPGSAFKEQLFSLGIPKPTSAAAPAATEPELRRASRWLPIAGLLLPAAFFAVRRRPS